MTHSPGSTDIACAMAHGEVPAPTGQRHLVAVFASPVALQLVHLAAHCGWTCTVLDPTGLDPHGRTLDGVRTVTSAADAGLNEATDVVVTDHDRPELGDVLADVLRHTTRWVGVMARTISANTHGMGANLPGQSPRACGQLIQMRFCGAHSAGIL